MTCRQGSGQSTHGVSVRRCRAGTSPWVPRPRPAADQQRGPPVESGPQPTDFLADVGDIQSDGATETSPCPCRRLMSKKLRRIAITTLVTLLDLTNED